MRLEHLPVVLGLLVGLIGLALIADAWLPDEVFHLRERRRRPRAERHHLGEGLVGAGVLCMAAALIGRDVWRWGTVAIILGFLLLGIGIALNREYLREALFFRGAARRRPEGGEASEGVDSAGDIPARPAPGAEPNDTAERKRLRIR